MNGTVGPRSLPPRIVAAVQVVVLAALVVAAFIGSSRIDGLQQDNAAERRESDAVESILADACGAASFTDLREQGLVEECRLAQQGDLGEVIPENVNPEDVEDPVVDDPNSTPADVLPVPSDVDDAVAAEVAAYFDRNPLPQTPGYQRAITRAVGTYLTANPPAPGRPPTNAEITNAVSLALLANPPADGEDGVDGIDGGDGPPGRGVATAALDGCDVVFTYSDGGTDRVGPLCGPPGQDATSAQISDAVVAYCTANGDCRGPQGEPGIVEVADNCTPPDGEFVTNVDPVYDRDTQTFTLTCTSAPPPGILGR